MSTQPKKPCEYYAHATKTIVIRRRNGERLPIHFDWADYRRLRATGRSVFIAGGYPAIHIHRRIVRLHRWLMSSELADAPVGTTVDHRDRNRWNLRRSNLRVCSQAENSRNRSKPRNATSAMLGVSRSGKGWAARYYTGRTKYSRSIGTYRTEEAAARARDAFAELREGPAITRNFNDSKPALVLPKWFEETELGSVLELVGDVEIAVQFIYPD